LVWYMQEDSNNATECHIAYGANDYTINIGKNKRIDSGVLGRALHLHNQIFG